MVKNIALFELLQTALGGGSWRTQLFLWFVSYRRGNKHPNSPTWTGLLSSNPVLLSLPWLQTKPRSPVADGCNFALLAEAEELSNTLQEMKFIFNPNKHL